MIKAVHSNSHATELSGCNAREETEREKKWRDRKEGTARMNPLERQQHAGEYVRQIVNFIQSNVKLMTLSRYILIRHIIQHKVHLHWESAEMAVSGVTELSPLKRSVSGNLNKVSLQSPNFSASR